MLRQECVVKLEDCEKYLELADPCSADSVRAVLATLRALPVPRGACTACGTVVELQRGLVTEHTVAINTLNNYKIKCKGAGQEPATVYTRPVAPVAQP